MYNLAVLGLAPIGSIQAGALAETLGIRAALMLGGLICLVYFGVLLAFLPRLRRLGKLPQAGVPDSK